MLFNLIFLGIIYKKKFFFLFELIFYLNSFKLNSYISRGKIIKNKIKLDFEIN